MSQHDFDIANQGFPATRADINNALQAAVSNSAGTSAPSTTYAYQFWYDSTNNIIKMRNGDNDAWISVATVDQTNDLVSITHTGMLDLVDDDGSASIRFQAPSTVTSTTTFTLPDGDGDSGQTLITNGSGTLSWHAPYGNRNLIINGALQIRQRSDATGVTSTQYVNDRFQQILGTAGTWSISRSTEAPAGFSNSMKLDCTTANASLSAGSIYLLGQKLEGQNLQHLGYGASGAKKLTLSFWVRSNKTGTYIIEFFFFFYTRTQSQSYTIDVAETWEHKSITIDGDTAAGGALANDNSDELAVYWYVVAGSDYSSGTLNTSWASKTDANRAVGQVNLADSTSNEWYLTGVQLEVGEQATPFEHRSYADELQRCRRYYQNLFPVTASARLLFPMGHYADGNFLRFIAEFPAMRAAPSLTYTGTANSHYGVSSQASIVSGFTFGSEQISERSCVLQANKTGHGVANTTNTANFFTTNNGGPKLDAEL